MTSLRALPEVTRRQLMALARRAAERAYSPYSHFRVGAALLGDTGQIVVGANVENASYGLTNCAERTAIFAAATAGMRKLRGIALTCLDAKPDAPAIHRMPCGACRQVIAEFADEQTEIHIDGVGLMSLAEVLPLAFVLPQPPRPVPAERPRVLIRGPVPPGWNELYEISDWDPLAVITTDRNEARRAALERRHALTFGPEDEFVHGCANWDEALTLLKELVGVSR